MTSTLTTWRAGRKARQAARNAELDRQDREAAEQLAAGATLQNRRDRANAEYWGKIREQWDNARGKESLPSLGVVVASGQVWKNQRGIGPLRGAYAGVTDGTRVHRVGRPVAASMVAGPVALLGALSTKTKAVSVVTLANGRTIEHKLDGNYAVRKAQQEAARFNARAGAA